MKQRALSGERSTPIEVGGKVGYVWLKATVPPELKTRLVRRAEVEGTTFTAQVRSALQRGLS